jgi:hypothetical protein
MNDHKYLIDQARQTANTPVHNWIYPAGLLRSLADALEARESAEPPEPEEQSEADQIVRRLVDNLVRACSAVGSTEWDKHELGEARARARTAVLEAFRTRDEELAQLRANAQDSDNPSGFVLSNVRYLDTTEEGTYRWRASISPPKWRHRMRIGAKGPGGGTLQYIEWRPQAGELVWAEIRVVGPGSQ